MTNKELANLIFPDIHETIDDLEKRYPERNLPTGAEVTRFAPSPTGFLHTGSLFTSLICYKVAKQSKGVFYTRLEDTDTKREIQGSGLELLSQLHEFGIIPDEGYMGDHEVGDYGPYVQSQRARIYKIVIKDLIEKGLAYPCFCSKEELAEVAEYQEKNKLNTGYYGEFAKCRNLSNEERAERIKRGDKYILRFRSSGDHTQKVMAHDVIRGDFEIAQNDLDVIILKGDGLPTYHFAHAVDDHFMRTTTVIRGQEWIASLPIHIELFETLGWKAPRYAHLPVIMKLDENGNRRKLSKRYDSEAACSFFLEDGYPTDALIMYLMTIANSNFEKWIFDQHFDNMDEFEFHLEKMSNDGALFDMGKVNFFAKEILGKMNKNQITEFAKEYAKKYDKKLLDIIEYDENYFKEIMNIEREKENPRKDYEKISAIAPVIEFFYDEQYKMIVDTGLCFNEKFAKENIIEVLLAMKQELSLDQDEQSWFNNMKDIAIRLGFAANNKMFKTAPEQYKGTVGDVAEMLRIALTGKKNSPNLYYVMTILGKANCDKRIDYIISLL